MRIVLTGGGTMGHVMPNIAVIEELKSKCALSDLPLDILYIGSYFGPEKEAISKRNIKFKPVLTGKLRRYFSFKNLSDFIKLPFGVIQALGRLLIFKPQIVFSKGGYVSLPVCLAAYLLRVPVVMHESDLSPGLANKISAKFAGVICVSFEESKQFFEGKKVVFTGNPIRKEILEGSKKTGLQITHLPGKKPVLLVMGGSQGAMEINNLVRENLDFLLSKFEVLHIVGKGNVLPAFKQKTYAQFEYADEDLKHFYAISDFVISRGGAGSLAEIGALGLAALIIPLSHGSSRGDQVENAKVFVKNYPAISIEGKISKEKFIGAVNDLAELKPTGAKNSEGAAKVVKVLLDLFLKKQA